MGESFGNYSIGNDDLIFPYITSSNVACGFHGGDPLQIEKTIKKALENGVQVGAHPGFPDLQGFGRRRMQVPPNELRAIVKYQIAAVKGITESLGGQLAYIKPHGALYNTAVEDESIATAIAQAVAEIDTNLTLMSLAGSQVSNVAKKIGIPYVAEAFADRQYTSEGRLMSRRLAGAVIHDAAKAAQQVLSIVKNQYVTSKEGKKVKVQAQTICIHGDNPQVVNILKAIDTILAENSILKKAF